MASLLEVPYVSQLGPGAEKFHNDCGAASGVMMIKAYTGTALTVDEFYQEIGDDVFGDPFLTVSQVGRVLKARGLPWEWRANMTLSELFLTLIHKQPFIALLKYGVLVKAGLTENKKFRGPHFAVVVGCDIDNVYIHDPLWKEEGGKALAIPIQIFMNAWEAVGQDPLVDNPSCGAMVPTLALGDNVDASDVVRVTSRLGLNVRSGPSVEHAKVSSVNEGARVILLERREVNGDEWGRIGVNRWIALKFAGEDLVASVGA